MVGVVTTATSSTISRAFRRQGHQTLFAICTTFSPPSHHNNKQQVNTVQIRYINFLQFQNKKKSLGAVRYQQLLKKNHRLLSSSSKRDFYNVLDVSKGADKTEIKKAYFKLAKEHHPDTNRGDEKAAEKFKEASEAYEVLSDGEKRQLYDQFGHAGLDPNSGFQQGGGNPFGGFGNPFGGSGDGQSFQFESSGREIDPEELFEAFFGGGRRRPRGPQPGADLQMHVNVSFKEAVFGTSKDLHLRYQIRNKEGRAEVKERDVTVEVPAGIDTGLSLRLSGQGAEGDPGASRGNLLVQVIVDDDDYFIRDGYDVHTEIPISLTQAVLGGTADVETLSGDVELKIPKGCQLDTKLMLRGKGIQKLRSSKNYGNQIVHLKIEIPKSISARQEELLREFDEETKKSGKGISGKLSEAVGSAFSNLFGSCNKQSENENKDDEDDGAKKQAAQ